MRWVARLALIGFLVLAAGGKLLESAGTGLRWTQLTGIAVLELVSAGALTWRRSCRDATTAVVSGFSAAAVVNLIDLAIHPGRSRVLCGCLGAVARMSKGESLLVQGVVIAVAALAWGERSADASSPRERRVPL